MINGFLFFLVIVAISLACCIPSLDTYCTISPYCTVPQHCTSLQPMAFPSLDEARSNALELNEVERTYPTKCPTETWSQTVSR